MKYLESIRAGIDHLLESDDRTIVLGEDIVDPYGGAFKVTKGLSTKYPDRVLSMPISESAIVGASIGLAMEGFKPICEIMFGDFITLATDQIVNSGSKFNWMYNDKVMIPLVIRTAVGGYRGYGPTHSQSLESMFLNVPGLDVISPTIFGDPGRLLAIAHESTKPALFIEHKVSYPKKLASGRSKSAGILSVTQTLDNFPEYRVLPTTDQKIDLVVIAYGEVASMVGEIAEELFLDEEICVMLIVPTLLNQSPSESTVNLVRSCGKALIVEEGHEQFGWASHMSRMVTDQAFESLTKPISVLGAKQVPIGNASSLEEQILPSRALIKKQIATLIGY